MGKPVYDAKVNKIIGMLKFKNRDEVVTELGYNSYQSLDMYMRRRNFRFDSEKQQYVPQARLTKPGHSLVSEPIKVANIITEFENEGADPKIVAEKTGFKDHKEMANYMKDEGYKWCTRENNYVKEFGKIEEESDDVIVLMPNLLKQQLESGENKKLLEKNGIEKYLPLLRYLFENQEKIYQLLSGTKDDGRMPRYAVPGLARTKAIYMSDVVIQLMVEFSRKKNTTQREVVEVALIEFFKKYGFRHEIEAVLKSS